MGRASASLKLHIRQWKRWKNQIGEGRRALTGKIGNLKARGGNVTSLTPAARHFIVMPLFLFFESTECPVVRRSPFLWNSGDLSFKDLDCLH
jgi:hypothetical protein